MTVTSSSPRQLDRGQAEIEADRLLDPAEVDHREHADEHCPHHQLRQLHELRQVVAAERRRQGRRRRHAGAHDRERDQERDERAPERLVRVERGAGRLRVLRDELGVRGGSERGQDAGGQERGPDRAADLAGDLAHERVDARAEHVADHEHGEHRARDRRAQGVDLRSTAPAVVAAVVMGPPYPG
jgi:hypothetical protein